MLYLVKVRFMPGGSMCPEEFFRRINAVWCMTESKDEGAHVRSVRGAGGGEAEVNGFCIAEFDSIEQLAVDLSVMPGAGIANISIESLSAAGVTALPGRNL
jgi:hypothetical protein